MRMIDYYGIDPEEIRASLEEAALGAGDSPADAAMFALDGAMDMASREFTGPLIFDPDNGEGPVAL